MDMKRNLLVLLLACILSELASGIFGPIYILLYQKVGDFSATSISFGIFSLTIAVLEAPFGYLSDKYGKKPFIVFGGILTSIVSLLYLFVSTPLQLYILEVLAGIATSMQAPVLKSLISETAPKKKRGKIFGLFDSSVNFTYGLASIISGLIFGIFGLEFIFFISSALHASSVALTCKIKF